ncbi:MAG: hypothetical protein ONB13_06840 [candidate division KSB1 bacterium]|nr:hypothetical protein [candidate division KSB1 bacterium]
MMKSILRRLLEWIAPFLRSEVKRALLHFVLDPLRHYNIDSHNVGVVSIYAVVDVLIEKKTQKTLNKLDDAIVRGFLDAFYESAEISGIAAELPQLDQD